MFVSQLIHNDFVMFTLTHLIANRIFLIATSSIRRYPFGIETLLASDITKIVVAILLGAAVLLCIWVFRKGIQRFFRLLFTLILNVLFGLFLFFAILGVGYLIDNYAVSKGSGPTVHILHYATSALFVLSFLSAVVMLVRAVWKFAQGLFGRGVSS